MDIVGTLIRTKGATMPVDFLPWLPFSLGEPKQFESRYAKAEHTVTLVPSAGDDKLVVVGGNCERMV